MDPKQFRSLAIDRATAEIAESQRRRNQEILRSASIPIGKQVQLLSEQQRKELVANAIRAVEGMRPKINKVFAEQREQQIKSLRQATAGVDVASIVRAATEQLRISNEPAIKQVALTALQNEALQAAAQQASRTAFAALSKYDWGSLSQQLSAQAEDLLTEVGAADRLEEIRQTALAGARQPGVGTAGATEDPPAEELDGQELVDAVQDLIEQVKSEGEATREVLAKGLARDAVDYIAFFIALAAALFALGSFLTDLEARKQEQPTPPAGIVIEPPEQPSPDKPSPLPSATEAPRREGERGKEPRGDEPRGQEGETAERRRKR